MLFRFYRVLKDKPHNKQLVQALIIINILGSIYGYYWYKNQLAATQFKFWLFVPDSPFSTTLFAIALIIFLKNKKETWFHCIAYLGVIKYGLWAVIVITHYWISSGEIRFTEAMLWFSHFGMALQGLIYFRHLRVTKLSAVIVVSWFFIWDYVDYALNLHPYLYLSSQWGLALMTVVSLSVILGSWAFGKNYLEKNYMEDYIS